MKHLYPTACGNHIENHETVKSYEAVKPLIDLFIVLSIAVDGEIGTIR